MSRGAIARINLAALEYNLARVRELTPHSNCLAMIKSNGYGHGLLEVAQGLSSADALGVACLEEALALRKVGNKLPIVVMSGFTQREEIPFFLQHNLTAVIHDACQLAMMSDIQEENSLSVWLKVDTGMHRLGFTPDEAVKVFSQLQDNKAVKKPMCLMTHFADADNGDESYTHQQIQCFSEFLNIISPDKTVKTSMANSAGILFFPKSHADWVRPGIMLYGVSPVMGRCGYDEGLRPVMSLEARLIGRKHLKKGDAVGYGCTWRCPTDMPVGVVAMGYGDGYPRHARNGTPTMIGGKVCPLVGRVSMDLLTVDLRVAPNAAVGDTVVLWGEGLPVERVAECADTIAYELLCSITRRVKFIVEDGECQ